MKTTNKKQTGYWSSDIWPTFPATIFWMQQERDAALAKNEILFKMKARYRGINASIILLSACYIEGFLTACLQSFVSRLNPKDTFDDRLKHFYLDRASNATFKDFQGLFNLAVGKSLNELISNKKLIEGVAMLFKFRNGLAHSRPALYNLYLSDDSIEPEPELVGHYKEVEDYLTKNKLCTGTEIMFTAKFADHFAGLVEPFMREVLSVLPKGNATSMSHLVRVAFIETKLIKFD